VPITNISTFTSYFLHVTRLVDYSQGLLTKSLGHETRFMAL